MASETMEAPPAPDTRVVKRIMARVAKGTRKQFTDDEWTALALLNDSQITTQLMHQMGLESMAELKGFRRGFAIGLWCRSFKKPDEDGD